MVDHDELLEQSHDDNAHNKVTPALPAIGHGHTLAADDGFKAAFKAEGQDPPVDVLEVDGEAMLDVRCAGVDNRMEVVADAIEAVVIDLNDFNVKDPFLGEA